MMHHLAYCLVSFPWNMSIRCWSLTAENGAIRPHPAIRVQHSAFTNARQLAAEMGLTPVSRSRPALNDDTDEKGGFGDLVD